MENIRVTHQRIYTFNMKYHYDSKKVIRALRMNEDIEEIECHEDFISFLDFDYPSSLMCLALPPTCLFYKGNIELLKRPSVGIIGSRESSEYGRSICNEIIRRLPKEYVVVSGMAKGIDGIAQGSAIFYGHKTIGVIGSGLDYVYPKENDNLFKIVKKDHLLISEYCHDEPIMKEHFIARNRIIAGLSDILIVIESKIHSGTSITVREMLDLGKDVYVIPHSLTSATGKGNLKMINDGANIIWDLDDFIEMLKNDLTKS